MYVCVCVCVCVRARVCVCVYTYIYIYITLPQSLRCLRVEGQCLVKEERGKGLGRTGL